VSPKRHRKDEGAVVGSQCVSSGGIKDAGEKKLRPVREESFPARLVFERNDFSYIDAIVDPDRAHRSGPKGYPPSSMFMALLLMYLKEIKTIIGLWSVSSGTPPSGSASSA
jgi:hypothetical protein